MSVIYTQGAAVSINQATESAIGGARLATSAEVATGTDNTTIVTPQKLAEKIASSIVGAVQYQGTFDASAGTPDLSNAQKGDLYIVDTDGTFQSIDFKAGDHLLINEDMGGTISASKIDKVDSTDAVTSVAGKDGAVTLVVADLDDVDTTGVATNNVLKYDGANWVDAVAA